MKTPIVWACALGGACTAAIVAGWAGYASAQEAAGPIAGERAEQAYCEELVDPEENVCQDCTDGDPWEDPCECIVDPEGPDYCRNLPPVSQCEKTKQPQRASVNTIVKQITVPCYRTYQCKPPNAQEECGAGNECRKTETGHSENNGNKYVTEEADCIYVPPGPGGG